MTPTITEWVLVIALNGWMVDVDAFRSRDICVDRQQTYIRATSQAGSGAMAWCEKRTTSKLPTALRKY